MFLEVYMGRHESRRGKDEVSFRGDDKPKIEDFTIAQRIKLASDVVAAIKETQDKFLAMGLTKPAAGVKAFELFEIVQVDYRDFEDYDEDRDDRGGH
ncbi:hypothetical protein JNK62_00145 [bacterium]|nr:hypothetical protein [bacterium]